MKKCFVALTALVLCIMLAAGACAEIGAAPIASYNDVEWLDGTNLLVARGDTGYYLMGIDGTAITEAIYYDAFDYSYGLIEAAKVTDDEAECNIYGALDMNGQEVIPFQYGHLKISDSYWAICYKLIPTDANSYDFQTFFGDNYYLVDTVDIYNLESGACVKTLTREQFYDARTLPKGIVIEDRSGAVNGYDAQFNLVAENMRSLYTSEGVEELALGDGMLASYTEDYDNYGLKDAQGNVVLEPSFDYIYEFKGDYALIEEGDEKYGLIDRAGNVVVQPLYDDVLSTSFSRPEYGYDSKGYFAVVQDGKVGYVDAGGNVTAEPKYAEEAMEYRGLTCNYVDMQGNFCIFAADGTETTIELINDVNSGSLDYSYGMYYEAYDDEYNYALMDWHGELVFPYEYDDFAMSGDGAYLIVEKDYVCDIYEVK